MTKFLLRFLLKLVRFAGIVGFILVCVYLYNNVREGIFLDGNFAFRILLLLILFCSFENLFDVGSDSLWKKIAPGRQSRGSVPSDGE